MKSQLLEEALQRDIDQIRDKVLEMANLAETALRTSLQALNEKNQQLAYTVILRDRYIDELEKELDLLCQKFFVRHHPAAGHLRFVYAVIKINNELERIGDYAESIARHFLELCSIEPFPKYKRFVEIASLAIPMLRNAIQAFVDNNMDLANATIELEEKVDDLRYSVTQDLMRLRDDGQLSSEALAPLMIIASRFERVADQACNICEEVLFMGTGQNIKHEGVDVFRVLFVDANNSCVSQMAEGIGKSLGLDNVIFNSAGIAPQPVDPQTVRFLSEKGIDISKQNSKYLNEIPEPEAYQVIISLSKESDVAFPPPPTKTVSISWYINDPSQLKGTEQKIQAAYEKTYTVLNKNIHNLIDAVLIDDFQKEEGKT
jgi:phosphate transport system protein